MAGNMAFKVDQIYPDPSSPVVAYRVVSRTPTTVHFQELYYQGGWTPRTVFTRQSAFSKGVEQVKITPTLILKSS